MGCHNSKTLWRDPGREDWTQEKEEQLVKDIKDIDKEANEKDKKKIKAHAVLCGPNGAGKSSFINSAIGVCKGKQSIVSHAGASQAEGTSLTKMYIRAAAPDEFNNFRLSDTPGLLEPREKGLHTKDIMHLVNGHMKPGYRFQDWKPIDEENEYFVPNPTDDELVHCLVFVFDVTTIEFLNTNYEAKIRTIIGKLTEKEIPFVIVLTKIDLLDENVDEDITKMHESAKVKAAVKEASEKFKVQERDVFPVINHVKDIEIRPLTRIPHLIVLKNILEYAGDYIDTHINKKY